MGWAWTYLAVSVVGAALVVNAYRPWRSGPTSVVSFFTGWLTGELPIHNIVWQALATIVFAILGAFGSWPGWLGLAITLASWLGLVSLFREARRSDAVIDAALDGICGTGDAERAAKPTTADIADEIVKKVVDEIPLSDTMWRAWALVNPAARHRRTFATVRNVDYAGDGKKSHRLDVITRRGDPPKAGPVMVYVHGGAWIIGDKREQGYPMLLELSRRGWVCVTINYRLSPKNTWPDHIVDTKMAIAWVRENIAQFGGDPGFIAVSGGSAGGHLSALAALTPGDAGFQPGFEDRDTSVAACVPVYGVYDMTCQAKDGDLRHLRSYNRGLLRLLEREVFKAKFAESPAVFEQASPLYRVNEDAPPFFVIHGANDTLVPVSEARHFVKALRGVSHNPVAYAEMPRAQHAFDVLASVRPAHAVAGIVRFLDGVRNGTVSSATLPGATLSEAVESSDEAVGATGGASVAQDGSTAAMAREVTTTNP